MPGIEPNVLVRAISEPEIEQARLLLAANAWGPRVSDSTIFKRLVVQFQIALVAVEGQQVVGFLRAISDGIYNGYISMVGVAEDRRRRGIGTALVKKATGDDGRMTWVLRVGRNGASAFYESLGFSKSKLAMKRPGVRQLP